MLNKTNIIANLILNAQWLVYVSAALMYKITEFVHLSIYMFHTIPK
jgi:hypothetical protein